MDGKSTPVRSMTAIVWFSKLTWRATLRYPKGLPLWVAVSFRAGRAKRFDSPLRGFPSPRGARLPRPLVSDLTRVDFLHLTVLSDGGTRRRGDKEGTRECWPVLKEKILCLDIIRLAEPEKLYVIPNPNRCFVYLLNFSFTIFIIRLFLSKSSRRDATYIAVRKTVKIGRFNC